MAVIGCGWIGLGAQLDLLRPKPASHAEAISTNERLELAGFVDTNPEALAHAKKLYPGTGIFCSTAEELYGTLVPDAVMIATDAHSHCFHIKAAAKAGVKLIVSEKPISHSVEEAEEAIEVCKQYGSMLLINHMRRFDPLISSFKSYMRNEYVRDTAIGKIRSVVATFDNGLYHGGTHIVDLLRFFLGEVKAVSAVPRSQPAKCAEDDIIVDAILQFEHCNAMLYYFNSKEYALAEASFYGEKGSVHLRSMCGIKIEVIGAGSSMDYSAYSEPDHSNKRIFGESRSFMTGTYDHIVKCLDGVATPLCTGEDALQTLHVLKMIETSAGQNGMQVSSEEMKQTLKYI